VKGRDVVEEGGGYQLMEPAAPYKVDFDPENDLHTLITPILGPKRIEYQ